MTMPTFSVTLEVQISSIDMTDDEATAWAARPSQISLEHVSSSGSIEGNVTILGSGKECFVTISNLASPLKAKLL
jgi:hypothetical protein